MVVTVTPTRSEHAGELAKSLRAGDLAECLAGGYDDALSAVTDAVLRSTESWAVLFDGKLAALVGVDAKSYAPVTLVWALTSTAVDRAKLSFVRASRAIVAELRERYGILANIVDARYQGALDWLECLGFTIGPVIDHPITGAQFRRAFIIGVT